MPRGALGLFVGLVLGLALVFGSFGDMLVVALLGAIGFVVEKVAHGDIDISQYVGGRQR